MCMLDAHTAKEPPASSARTTARSLCSYAEPEQDSEAERPCALELTYLQRGLWPVLQCSYTEPEQDQQLAISSKLLSYCNDLLRYISEVLHTIGKQTRWLQHDLYSTRFSYCNDICVALSKAPPCVLAATRKMKKILKIKSSFQLYQFYIEELKKNVSFSNQGVEGQSESIILLSMSFLLDLAVKVFEESQSFLSYKALSFSSKP